MSPSVILKSHDYSDYQEREVCTEEKVILIA